MQFDRAGKSSKAQIAIDMASVRTGVGRSTATWKSKDFFDAAANPSATFRRRQFFFDGVQHRGGVLTLLGKSNPSRQGQQTSTATRARCSREVCGGDFETTSRAATGMAYGPPNFPPDSHPPADPDRGGQAVSAKPLAIGAPRLHLPEPGWPLPAPSRCPPPAHSFVHFEVMHFSTATLRGRFAPLDGIARTDRRAQRGEVSLTILTHIVSTGLPVLDSRPAPGRPVLQRGLPDVPISGARNFVFDGDALREVRGELRCAASAGHRWRCATSLRRAPDRQTRLDWRRLRGRTAAQRRHELRPAAGSRPRAPAGAVEAIRDQ